MRRPSLRPYRAGRGIILPLTLSLGFALCPTVWAEEQGPYLVGICILSDGGLPLSAKPFLTAFPRLLALSAKPLPPRFAEEDYRDEVEARLAAAETFRLGAELASKLDQKASISLDPQLSSAKRRESLAAAEAAIKVAASALEAHSSASLLSVGAGGQRETRLWDDGEGSNLIEQGEEDPASLAAGKGIDLLVHGEAKSIGNYVALQISGYDSSLDREVFRWQVYADPSDPAPLAEELALRLAAWVAGRPFAKADIAVDPPSALLLVDGKPFDAASSSIYRFDASRIILGAWAPGRASEALVLDLLPGDRKLVNISLPARSYGLAKLSTMPPGASLFSEGRALGKAPLGAELTGARSVIIAEAPGMESSLAVLPAEGSADLNLLLRPEDGLGPGGRIEKARDGFYRALGWLVLSLPVASISLDAFRSYNEAYLRSEDSGLLASRNVAGISFAASAALGTGLAVNALIRLGRYIGSAR